MSKKNKKQSKISDSLLGLGLSAGLLGGLTGLIGDNMKGMFGDDILDMERVVKSIAHGNIQGILEHFDFERDELKRRIKTLEERCERLKEELDKEKELKIKLEIDNEMLKEFQQKFKTEVKKKSKKKKK